MVCSEVYHRIFICHDVFYTRIPQFLIMSHNGVTQAIPDFEPKATLAILLDRTPENQRVTAMQTDERKDREGKVSVFSLCIISPH
jgi:hypothetical protein